MGLFDDDYSFDDLLGDLDFSYPVGTDTSGDISEYGSSVFDIYDTAGADSLDAMLQDELYGGSGSSIFDIYDTAGANSLDDLIQEEIYGGSGSSIFDTAGVNSLDDLIKEESGDEDVWQGPFGWGIIPGIRNTIFGQGSGPLGGNVLEGGGILGQLLGFGGQGGGQGGGGLFGGGGEAGESGLGSFLSGANPLMQFLAMKSLMKDDGGGGGAPIGGQAYGGPAFNYQDYQPTNLQPALMPGVAYANMGAPGMISGGLAMPSSADLERRRQNVLEQPGLTSGLEMGMPSFARPGIRVEVEEPSTQEILAAIQNDQVVELGDGSVVVAVDGQYTIISPRRLAGIKDAWRRKGFTGMQSGGSTDDRPGDITFAKLEPGEFVIQKPAVDAIGIETLRKINSMGDGRPYYG